MDNDRKNSVLKITNTSGYRGIGWCKTANKWRVRICLYDRDSKIQKYKHLGHFTNIEDAIKARKDAEDKYWFKDNIGVNIMEEEQDTSGGLGALWIETLAKVEDEENDAEDQTYDDASE